MKTSRRAGALLLFALTSSGCAAAGQGPAPRSASSGASLGLSTTLSLRSSHRPKHKASPLSDACRGGNSKSCNELGDRLAIKHAHTEARHWYMISCERMRAAMVPTATRLLQLSRELSESADRAQKLKDDAAELKARIQGCFDSGETLKADQEPKQALTLYDAVCEFSTLAEAVGDTIAGFELVTQSGCAASAAMRDKLNLETPFTPQLFVNLSEQQAGGSADQAEVGMVFSADEL